MTSMSIKSEDIDLSVHILCPYCKNVYTDPVSLPCGRNICKEHVKGYLTSKDGKQVFNCMLCKSDHQTNENDSFTLNTKIDELVKKCQVRATPIQDIHKTAYESYNKLTGMI